ncbi:MAG: MFS transporter [Thermomicrobiales bacterium]|nr:MAG: MFS transporter [Thermomicrobiales bacterium]
MALPSFRRIDRAAVLACVALALVGWSSLLVPSLIRSIEPAFNQTDAGIGVFFFVNAIAYVSGSMLGGVLTERIGRRVILPMALVLITAGLAGMAGAPSWSLFLVAAVPLGLGAGAVDGGTNGLILDLYPSSRGRSLNLLHLCFSIGSLGSPLVVGRLVEIGVGWQSIVFGTALVAIPLALLLGLADQPSGRHVHAGPAGSVRIGLALPLVALAIAIACYVGSEVGVSHWLVRYLDSASVGLATSALALFWGGLTIGRLMSAKIGDRFDHARFAATAALVAGVTLAGAVAAPSLEVSILLFALAGVAYGPIYPLIMAVAGDRYPGRSAAVSGFLAGTAVIGAILYPPVMGLMSVSVGLGAAMAGAAALAGACALVLALIARGTFNGPRATAS